MRLNDIGICNMALALAGISDYIQSLTDKTSPQAIRCNQFFLPCVEIVLRSHPSGWNSAAEVVELAANTSVPTTLYDHAYPLPHDCVRVISVYGKADAYSPYDRWRVVGRNIETDLDRIYLKYVKMPEDYHDLDILLADSIAHQIALKLVLAHIKDKEMYQLLAIAYERALNKAMAMDTLENKEAFAENSPWEDARV